MDKLFGKMLASRIEEMNAKRGTDWLFEYSDNSVCGPTYEMARIYRPNGSTIKIVTQATDTLRIIEAYLDGILDAEKK